MLTEYDSVLEFARQIATDILSRVEDSYVYSRPLNAPTLERFELYEQFNYIIEIRLSGSSRSDKRSNNILVDYKPKSKYQNFNSYTIKYKGETFSLFELINFIKNGVYDRIPNRGS